MRPLLELQARNFRSLRDVRVPLQPLNVLVGPNNSGKTNFLDLIGFLGDSARMDLGPAFDVRGGFERVRFRGKPAGPIRIDVKANITPYSSLNAPDEYSLQVRSLAARTTHGNQERVLVRNEDFKFKRTQGRGRRVTVSGRRVDVVDERQAGGEETRRTLGLQSESLGLATLPKLSDQEGGEGIRRIAELFATFRVFDVNVPAARKPAPLEAGPLREDASNLAAFLYRLREETQDFDDLEADARALIPGLEAIAFEEVGGATSGMTIRLREQGLTGLTDLADASFGTIRMLALLALLYDPAPPLLTCVEEIDHGLHPYLFDRLVDRLRDASDRTQFLLATHSPALVNRLSPEELIVCERGPDGASRIPAIDSEQVRQMEEAAGGRIGLGELWFAGSLGGVPE